MGSRGTNRFTDYPGAQGGGSIGDGQPEPCPESIGLTELDNVERSAYWADNTGPPPTGTDVEVSPTLIEGRIPVLILGTDSVLGVLPTRLNYLLACLEQYAYRGEVVAVARTPLPQVMITLQRS